MTPPAVFDLPWGSITRSGLGFLSGAVEGNATYLSEGDGKRAARRFKEELKRIIKGAK